MESKTNNPNNNNSFDIENLFILRMPASKDGSLKPATLKLRQMIESGTALDQHLFINLDLDTRNGSIKLDDELFKGRLVDLPCIIESLKTNDKKTLYKTGEICQMFVCNDNHVAEESDHHTADKYIWMHGITPPLKNARKKRFRKVAKKKIVDYVEIEKQVKSLFRADRDAIKVEYEVLYVDEPRETQTDDELLFNDDVDKKKHFNKNNNTNNNAIGNSNKKPVYESILLATGDDSSMMNIMNNMESTSSPYGIHADSSNDAQLVSRAGKNTTKSSEYNFFMEEVIGDLSSSSDESDNNDSDSKDESKMKDNKNRRSFEVMDIGDESTNLYAPNIDANTNSVTFSNLNYDEDDSSMMMNLFADDNSNTAHHQHHRHQLPNDNDDKGSTQQHQHMSLSAESTNQSGVSSPATTSTSSLHSLQDTFNKNELNKKLEQLLDDYEQVQGQRKRQEEEINQINNPVLKSRLLPRLNELIDEESKKLGEIENLRHTLSLL